MINMLYSRGFMLNTREKSSFVDKIAKGTILALAAGSVLSICVLIIQQRRFALLRVFASGAQINRCPYMTEAICVDYLLAEIAKARDGKPFDRQILYLFHGEPFRVVAPNWNLLSESQSYVVKRVVLARCGVKKDEVELWKDQYPDPPATFREGPAESFGFH